MSADLINVADFEQAAAEKLDAGVAGARRVLELLREELELTLAFYGCASPAELTRAHLRRAPSASVYSA